MKLSTIPLWLLLIATKLAECRKPVVPGDFHMKYFWGERARGIVKLYYSWTIIIWEDRPPFCYGALIDWTKAVVPCNCVAYKDSRHLMNDPWNHHETGVPVGKVHENQVYLGLMIDEYVNPETGHDWYPPKTRRRREALKTNEKNGYNKRKITKILVAPNCDSTYHHNMALVEIEKPFKGAKLTWVHTAERIVMNWSINKVAIAGSTSGRCEILRWVKKETFHPNHDRSTYKRVKRDKDDNVVKSSTDYGLLTRGDGRNHTMVLESDAVFLTNWIDCLDNVCPVYKPSDRPGKQRYEECANEIDPTSRYCVKWYQDSSLCRVLPGTPVFCDVDKIHGLIGLLSNATLYCPVNYNFNSVMTGLDEILDGLYDTLRIRNSKDYEAKIPTIIKNARQWEMWTAKVQNEEGVPLMNAGLLSADLSMGASTTIVAVLVTRIIHQFLTLGSCAYL